MQIGTVVGMAVLLLATPTLSQVADDKLIVPGERIGKWRLAATKEDLTAVNGAGRDGAVTDEDAQPDWLELSWPSLGLRAGHQRGSNQTAYLAIIPGTQVPTGVLLSYRTSERIGHLSRLVEIVGAYGNPPIRTVAGKVELPPRTLTLSRLIYDEKGIALTLLEMRDVWGIVIFAPGTAKTLWRY